MDAQDHSIITPPPLVALVGVRSKVQELQGRLQHCLVDLLTLQVEADNAGDAASSIKAAQLLPSATAAHGNEAKLRPVEPLLLHGGDRSMAASEEAWVQVSARQRQQQQEVLPVPLHLTSDFQPGAAPTEPVMVRFSHASSSSSGGDSRLSGPIGTAAMHHDSHEGAAAASYGGDEGSPSLDGEDDDFEAQLRASEAPPPSGNGFTSMLAEVPPPSLPWQQAMQAQSQGVHAGQLPTGSGRSGAAGGWRFCSNPDGGSAYSVEVPPPSPASEGNHPAPGWKLQAASGSSYSVDIGSPAPSPVDGTTGESNIPRPASGWSFQAGSGNSYQVGVKPSSASAPSLIGPQADGSSSSSPHPASGWRLQAGSDNSYQVDTGADPSPGPVSFGSLPPPSPPAPPAAAAPIGVGFQVPVGGATSFGLVDSKQHPPSPPPPIRFGLGSPETVAPPPSPSPPIRFGLGSFEQEAASPPSPQPIRFGLGIFEPEAAPPSGIPPPIQFGLGAANHPPAALPLPIKFGIELPPAVPGSASSPPVAAAALPAPPPKQQGWSAPGSSSSFTGGKVNVLMLPPPRSAAGAASSRATVDASMLAAGGIESDVKEEDEEDGDDTLRASEAGAAAAEPSSITASKPKPAASRVISGAMEKLRMLGVEPGSVVSSAASSPLGPPHAASSPLGPPHAATDGGGVTVLAGQSSGLSLGRVGRQQQMGQAASAGGMPRYVLPLEQQQSLPADAPGALMSRQRQQQAEGGGGGALMSHQRQPAAGELVVERVMQRLGLEPETAHSGGMSGQRGSHQYQWQHSDSGTPGQYQPLSSDEGEEYDDKGFVPGGADDEDEEEEEEDYAAAAVSHGSFVAGGGGGGAQAAAAAAPWRGLEGAVRRRETLHHLAQQNSQRAARGATAGGLPQRAAAAAPGAQSEPGGGGRRQVLLQRGAAAAAAPPDSAGGLPAADLLVEPPLALPGPPPSVPRFEEEWTNASPALAVGPSTSAAGAAAGATIPARVVTAMSAPSAADVVVTSATGRTAQQYFLAHGYRGRFDDGPAVPAALPPSSLAAEFFQHGGATAAPPAMSAAPATPSSGAISASLAAFGRRTSGNQPPTPLHPPTHDASFQFPSRAQSLAGGAAPAEGHSLAASRRSTLDDINEQQQYGDSGRLQPSDTGTSRLAASDGWPSSLGGGRGDGVPVAAAAAGSAVELTRALLSRLTTDSIVDASDKTRITSGGSGGYELPASVFSRLAAASSGGGGNDNRSRAGAAVAASALDDERHSLMLLQLQREFPAGHQPSLELLQFLADLLHAEGSNRTVVPPYANEALQREMLASLTAAGSEGGGAATAASSSSRVVVPGAQARSLPHSDGGLENYVLEGSSSLPCDTFFVESPRWVGQQQQQPMGRGTYAAEAAFPQAWQQQPRDVPPPAEEAIGEDIPEDEGLLLMDLRDGDDDCGVLDGMVYEEEASGELSGSVDVSPVLVGNPLYSLDLQDLQRDGAGGHMVAGGSCPGGGHVAAGIHPNRSCPGARAQPAAPARVGGGQLVSGHAGGEAKLLAALVATLPNSPVVTQAAALAAELVLQQMSGGGGGAMPTGGTRARRILSGLMDRSGTVKSSDSDGSASFAPPAVQSAADEPARYASAPGGGTGPRGGGTAFKPLSQGGLPLPFPSRQQRAASGSTAVAASHRPTAAPLAPSLHTSAAGAAAPLALSRRSTVDDEDNAAPSAAFDEGQLMLSSMAEMEREDELHDAHALRNHNRQAAAEEHSDDDEEPGGPPPVDVMEGGLADLCFTAQLEGADADEDGDLAQGWMRLVQVAELEAGSQRRTADEAAPTHMQLSGGGGQGAPAAPDSLPAALRAVLIQLAGSIPAMNRGGPPHSQPGTGPAPRNLSSNGAQGTVAAGLKDQAGRRVAAASMPGGMAWEGASRTSKDGGNSLTSAIPTANATALPGSGEVELLSESPSWYTSTATTGSRASILGSSSGGQGFGGSSGGGNTTATAGSRAGSLEISKGDNHVESAGREQLRAKSAAGVLGGRPSAASGSVVSNAGDGSQGGGNRRASILAASVSAGAEEGPLTSLLRSLGLADEDAMEEPAAAATVNSEPRSGLGPTVSEPRGGLGPPVSEPGYRSSRHHGAAADSPIKMRAIPTASAPGSIPAWLSSPASQQKPRPTAAAAAAAGSPTKSCVASAPGSAPEPSFVSAAPQRVPPQQQPRPAACTLQGVQRHLRESPSANIEAAALLPDLEGLSGANELQGLREVLLCALPVWRLSQELGGGGGGKRHQSPAAAHSGPLRRAAAEAALLHDPAALRDLAMLRLAFRQWARATGSASSSPQPRGQKQQQPLLRPAGGRRAATSPGGGGQQQQHEGSRHNSSSLFSNAAAAGSPAMRANGGYSSSPGGSHAAASPSLRSALRPLRLHPATSAAAGAGDTAVGRNRADVQQKVDDADARTTQRALAQQLLRQLASLGLAPEEGGGRAVVTAGRPATPALMLGLMMEGASAPYSSPQHAGVAAMAYALPPYGGPHASAPGPHPLIMAVQGPAGSTAAFNIQPQSPKVAIAVVAAAVHPAVGGMSRLHLGLAPGGPPRILPPPYYD